VLGVGGVRDSAGRPGTGAVCPRRDVLPQLNPTLKLTGHSIGSGGRRGLYCCGPQLTATDRLLEWKLQQTSIGRAIRPRAVFASL
jgi:hypothetical protein